MCHVPRPNSMHLLGAQAPFLSPKPISHKLLKPTLQIVTSSIIFFLQVEFSEVVSQISPWFLILCFQLVIPAFVDNFMFVFLFHFSWFSHSISSFVFSLLNTTNAFCIKGKRSENINHSNLWILQYRFCFVSFFLSLSLFAVGQDKMKRNKNNMNRYSNLSSLIQHLTIMFSLFDNSTSAAEAAAVVAAGIRIWWLLILGFIVQLTSSDPLFSSRISKKS